jgi:hypothetical protein
MDDRAPGVMRKPVQERDRIDPRDRRARGELSGRDRFERSGAMGRPKVGERLGGALEILNGGLTAGDLLGQFVIGRVARSGGDRKIR